MPVNSSLLKVSFCTWHWNRIQFLLKSAQILILSFQFLLLLTGDFLSYSDLQYATFPQNVYNTVVFVLRCWDVYLHYSNVSKKAWTQKMQKQNTLLIKWATHFSTSWFWSTLFPLCNCFTLAKNRIHCKFLI